MKKNSIIVLIVLCSTLSILIGLGVGYVLYNKDIPKTDLDKVEEEKEETLSIYDETVVELYETVEKTEDFFKTGSDGTSDFNVDSFYTGKKVQASDLSEDFKLTLAVRKLSKVNSDFEVSEKEVKDSYEKIFGEGFKANSFNYLVSGAKVIYENGTFKIGKSLNIGFGGGYYGYMIKTATKKGDNIYIDEIMYYVDTDVETSEYEILTNSTYDETYTSIGKTQNFLEIETIVEDNIDKFVTYRFNFEKNKDNYLFKYVEKVK